VAVAFWVSIGAILYTYVGFPLLLAARAALRPRAVDAAAVTPPVTVVIAAHDEAAVIGAKVRNVLAADYPSDRLRVLVASDGSTDATVDIVRSVARDDPRVEVLDLPRLGKARALNAAIDRADGEVLVFSDANSMLDRTSLLALVAPFADPAVGGVAGDQRYTRADGTGPIADAEERYWDLDRLLKRAGSRGGNVTSATGSLYALRRELVEHVPDGVTDDFFLSTGAIVRGRRLVFAPEAVTREPVATSAGVEFGRKARIVARGLRSVRARSVLLSPRRTGFYALQLWSHKVLRRLVVVPLVVAFVASLLGALVGDPVLTVAAAVQLVGYLAAAIGGALLLLQRRPARVLRLPLYFVLVNVAAAVGVVDALRGAAPVVWEPQRPQVGGTG
jgi:cellulose synthase/poly-beta-1,6-N-acetylglucosamine synthase-like glycosyltransferase